MRRFLFASAMVIAASGAALAADPRHPDWPCVQIKVPEISVGAVWSGPPIDDVGERWRNVPLVSDLVTRLAARRTPLDQAEKMIADYVSGTPAEKQDKAKLLFAGLFDALSAQRGQVTDGIERFSRSRRELAEKIRADTLLLQELQSAGDRDEAKLNELRNRIEWETRIFEDRRKTISYVCEVPVLIDRRLFALARAIQQSLE